MTCPEPSANWKGCLPLPPGGVELLAVLEEHADVVDRRLLAALDLGAVAGDERLGLQLGRRGAAALGHLGLGVDVGLARRRVDLLGGRRRGARGSASGSWPPTRPWRPTCRRRSPRCCRRSRRRRGRARGARRREAFGSSQTGASARHCADRGAAMAPPPPASRLDGAQKLAGRAADERGWRWLPGSSAPCSPCSCSASPCTRSTPSPGRAPRPRTRRSRAGSTPP